MIFKRTKIYAYLFIFLFVCFVPVVISLFISLMSKENPEPLLVVMAIVCLCIDALFLILSIVYILQKRDAITIQEDKVILKTYKEQVINFKDMKDIRKRCNYFNPDTRRIASLIGLVNSGYIVFILNDNKKYI